MKNSILLSVLFVFCVSVSAMAQTQKWNPEHVRGVIEHVQDNSQKYDKDQVSYTAMTLPDGNAVVVMVGQRDTIITMMEKKKNPMIQVFVSQPKDFTGNTLDGIQMIGSSKEYQDEIVIMENFLAKIATEKPLPPLGLFEGKDDLTKKLLAFKAYMEDSDLGPDSTMKYKKNSKGEAVSFYGHNVLPWVVISYTKNGKRTEFKFYTDMPVTSGTQDGGKLDLGFLESVLAFRVK